MRDWKSESEKLDVQQRKADEKLKDQAGVVRGMPDSAGGRTDEQQLLNEMKQNKAAVDLNRAMLDYEKERCDRSKG